MLGDRACGDWDSATVLNRIVSCLFLGFGVGTIIYMLPLLIISLSPLRFSAIQWMLATFGSVEVFLVFYILLYTLFTGAVLFILQKE